MENKKYEKYTLGWLREQQKIKSKKEGFDNIDDWLKWKADPFNILEKKYGKEFSDWARINKDKVPQHLIDSGCKTSKEYREKCAMNLGFKNEAEQNQLRRYNKGEQIPKGFNEDCTRYFGEYIAENYIMQTFEEPVPASSNNKYYDWICKNGLKIQSKARCLIVNDPKHPTPRWILSGIDYNTVTDYFIFSLWDNRDSLIPMHILIFHRDDIIRGEPFWQRRGISLCNTPYDLKEFENWEFIDRLEKLKNIINKEEYL